MILATWYHPLLAVLFAFLSLLLMAVILLQRGKGVGLSGAFGGAGGHTAFGAKTGDVLTWATIIIAAALLTYVIVLNFVFRPLQAPGAGSGVTPPPPPVSTPVSVPVQPVPQPAPAEEPVGETAPDASGGETTTTPDADAGETNPTTPDAGGGEANPTTPEAGGGDPPTFGIFGEDN